MKKLLLIVAFFFLAYSCYGQANYGTEIQSLSVAGTSNVVYTLSASDGTTTGSATFYTDPFNWLCDSMALMVEVVGVESTTFTGSYHGVPTRRNILTTNQDSILVIGTLIPQTASGYSTTVSLTGMTKLQTTNKAHISPTITGLIAGYYKGIMKVVLSNYHLEAVVIKIKFYAIRRKAIL